MSTTWTSDHRRLPFAVMLVVATAVAARSVLAAAPPPPKQYVEDLAGVIDPKTERRLLGYLQELEQKTTAQFIVLTVPTTEGDPIREYALRLAEAWKLGRKGKDNGLLLVVAVRDRKYTFETGYGLEGPLPDSFLGTVGRGHFQPNFRRGDYAKGIHDGVTAVLHRLAAHYRVTLSGVPKVKAPRRRARMGRGGQTAACGMGPMLALFVAIIVLSRLSRRWLGFWGLPIFFGHHRSYRSGGGWGGGFGGGGGGGFGGCGGGGGGGFGGGGASGGW